MSFVAVRSIVVVAMACFGGRLEAQQFEALKLDLFDGSPGAIDAHDGLVAIGGALGGDDVISVHVLPSGQQVAMLQPVDAVPSDFFGSSLAFSDEGDLLVVGASGDGQGVVYVYETDTWNQVATLTPDAGSAYDNFGVKLAAGDGVIAVAESLGSVFLFDAMSGEQLHQLSHAGKNLSGGGMAFAGDRLAVGVPSYFPGLAGRVLTFDLSTGAVIDVFAPATSTLSFGLSVAVDADRVAVGAPHADGPSLFGSPGAAFVGPLDGSTLSGFAHPPSYDNSGNFGAAVAASAGKVLVGADQDGPSGTASLFDADTQTLLAELHPSDAPPAAFFGSRVALTGDWAVVASNDGVYVFYVDIPPVVWTDIGFSLAGTNGAPQLSGSVISSTGVLAIELEQARPFAFAWFVVGAAQLDAPFKGGVLVPQPLFSVPFVTGPQGDVTFNGLWPPGIGVGIEVIAQSWILDPQGPKGFSSSNAIEGEVTP